MLVTRPAPVGSRIVDSLPFSWGGTLEDARRLKIAGCDGVALYLGAATKARAEAVLEAGMGVFGVTFGNTYNGVASAAQAKSLGLPKGTSIFLDLEGHDDWVRDPAELIKLINDWSAPVSAAGYLPCLYVGNPQPLTSAELHKLKVYRYWKGQGRCVDRTGDLAEPTNGWCMTQMYPSVSLGGVLVDHNMVGQDYKGRVPILAYSV